MANFGPATGYDLTSPAEPKKGYDLSTPKKAVSSSSVPGAFSSYEKPFNPDQKKSFLMSHGYNEDAAKSLMSGGNPIAKDTIKYPEPAKQKAGAGMAKKGLAVSPDSLEQLRGQSVPDDVIADEMAKASPHFASQLKTIRKKFNGDPAAISAFLNTRFYGTTNYTPGSQENKAYLTKVLDQIYGSANNILGEGGIMQQYNRGQISGGQAALRTAGQIYHGALTPVVKPATDITTGILDATGASDLIGAGVQAVRESEFGKQVEPYVQSAVEGYRNSSQDSGLRDLAALGQVGLDTATVLGANSAVNTVKRAGSRAVHPFQTIRHPVQSAKYVLGGNSPAQAEVRELTGSAKEAVSKGIDEKTMTFIAEQHPDTRAVMAKMTSEANKGAKVLGGTVKHKEILGGQMLDNAAYTLEQKEAVGQALGAMKKAVSAEPVNLTDTYLDFLSELRNKGAVINDKGVITALAGASDDNIPLLQKTLDFLSPDKSGVVFKTKGDVFQWRTKMFEEMNSAKSKLQPSSAGQAALGFAENATNKVRRASFIRAAGQNKNLIAANDAFEELSTGVSKFLKSIGYKGKISPEALTAKNLRAGEISLRSLGNASADTREAFQEIINLAKKYGRTSNIDESALIRYADVLEDFFPITPTRSLAGQVSRGTRDAAGNFVEDVAGGTSVKMGLLNRASEPVMKVYDKIRGLTPENRFRLLMEVLEAPPETDFFTIVQKTLPAAEAKKIPNVKGMDAGDVAKEFTDDVPLSQIDAGEAAIAAKETLADYTKRAASEGIQTPK